MLKIIAIDPRNRKFYDLSLKSKNILWSTNIEFSPGILSLTVVKGNQLYILEGFEIRVFYNDNPIFVGYITDRQRNGDDDLNIVAQDQTFYLKNEIVKPIVEETASTIFEKLCKEFKFKYAIKNPSTFKIENRIADKEKLWDVFQKAIKEATVGELKLFLIRDNVGTLEFYDVATVLPNVVNVRYETYGENSLVGDFTYDSSIAEDTYNRVIVSYHDSKTNKREVYNQTDNSSQPSIENWGILQTVINVDFELTPAKAQEIAKRVLQQKNRATKTFNISCYGNPNVKAGDVVILNFPELFELEKLKNLSYYIVKSCRHNFGAVHTMDLEVWIYYTIGG